MPVCTGGSEKQPSAPDYVHIDPTYLGSFLPPAVSWLLPYVQYIVPIELDLNAFCSLEPPDLPTIDATDVWALITKDVGGLGLTAGYKFAQLLHHIAWYRFCQCSVGSTPPIGTLPSAPSGLPAVNPPAYVSLPSSVPCLSATGTTVDYSPNNGLNNQGLMVWDQRNVTAVKWFWDVTVLTPPGPNVTVTAQELDQTNGSTIQFSKTIFLGHSSSNFTAGKYGSANAMSTRVQMDGTAGLTRVTPRMEVYCDGQMPGGTQDPCCPPDPFLQSQVASILELVTLIQRQQVPFATVDKTAHSGLTGSGEFDVQGLIGIRVDIISLPDSYGIRFGDPDQHFDIGWVAWGDPNAWHLPERVVADPHRSAPTYASACTRIGYSFNPGITCTIVEMAREP